MSSQAIQGWGERLRGRLREYWPIGAIGLLLALVQYLPPDTSLNQVIRSGVLRVCMPSDFPPLVTTSREMPGFDVQLLETIADRLGVRLLINANSAIGRDFNPRNWRVNRGQCEVLAGGVVGSELTRSFLDTTPAYLETGWAAVARDPSLRLEGARVGFFSGVSGLDRIALSRYLRARDTNVQIVTSAEALLDGLRAGRFDFAVSEALTARRIAGPLGLRATWLPGALDRYPIVLGLWKGDLTLKRRLSEVLGQLEREGVIAELARRYAITAIETLAAR